MRTGAPPLGEASVGVRSVACTRRPLRSLPSMNQSCGKALESTRAGQPVGPITPTLGRTHEFYFDGDSDLFEHHTTNDPGSDVGAAC